MRKIRGFDTVSSQNPHIYCRRPARKKRYLVLRKLRENDVRLVLAHEHMCRTNVERMNDAVVVTEDMEHRRDGKRNFRVVFERGKKRRFQPAERDDVAMAMFSTLRKSCCTASEEHHRV